MARRGRILTIVSWLTIVSLLPISWDGLPGLDMLDITRLSQSPLAHLPALVARLARAEVGDVPALHVKQPNAFPAEQTVLQRPGPKAFSQATGPAERKPEFDFSEAEQKGPGVRARRELPGEPLTEIGIHLQGVGGRRARTQDGKRVFDVPSSRAAMDPDAPLASQLLAQPLGTPSAQPTARTSASTPTVPTATSVPTVTIAPNRGVTSTATSTPAATAPPSTGGTATPTSTADPATPGGNRYGAHLEVVLEPTADGRGMKETVRLNERPRTNLLEYDLDLHGLTPRARSDGGLDLLDHLENPAFLVPAPTLKDARGRSGAAAFRLVGDQKLEVVLDQGTLDTGALPLEVDPTVIASDANLLPNAPAPWQRQSVVANDGTQAFFYYDSNSTAPGIYLLTSSNNFASTSGPSSVLASLGAGGFSVEIDRATNTIYLALTGSISSQNRLALYPLTYTSGTHSWTLGTRIDLAAHATNSWSGATVVIEEPKAPATTRYLWVGADKQAGTNYSFEARYTDLSTLGGTPTWTNTNPGFSTGTVSRYGSLLAADGGVVAFARDGTAQKSDTFARDCSPSACWRGIHNISTNMAARDGKEYSTVATPDFNEDGTAPLVPVIAFSPSTGGTNRQAIEYSVMRTGTSSWNSESTAAGSNDMYPQLTTDGTSFYLFRLKKNSNSDWEIRGQRVKLAVGSLDEDPDRTWLAEAVSGDRKIQWLTVPRALGSEILPFYYIRDKTTDQLMYDVKRLDLFGDRSIWSYQQVDLPGAGALKVNLANGNLHYEMTDANVPSRTWNDVIRRVYDSQNTSAYLMGPGWTGSFSPHLEFVGDKQINFWSDDGAKYIYLKDPNTGVWYPELGMHTILEKPNTNSSKVWRLTDLYGNRLLFNANGQATYKRNGETTDSSDSFWTWSYTSGVLSNIQGVTARNQAFSVSGGKIDQIKLLKPSFSAGSCTDTTSTDNCYVYKYAYDGNGRLTAATLIYNSVAYTGGVSGEQIRIEYGYETWPSTRLTSVKTPEGNVYSIGYDAQGRVSSIDLPAPASGQSATCGLTHCWQFAWQPGLGQVTVTDPRGKDWAYKTLGSGQVYERTDPLGHAVKRTWTAEQNLHSHTNPFDETTTFEYDANANRTKITNRQGQETQFTYYSNNRRQSKEDARTNLTTYDYDTNGDINPVTDALTHSVDHDFNSTRQLTSVSDARNNYTDYTYEAHGQVQTETRADGSKTTYTWDTWGRVTETRMGGTSASNDDQGSETTYDDLGRVTKVRIRMSASPTDNDNNIDLITQSTYSRDGQLLSTTDPMNGVTDYTVDNRGRVITTVMPGATAAARPCTTTEYLQNGLVSKQHVATARGSGSGCPGTSWSDTEFEYDDAGRRTKEKKTGLTTSEYSGGEIVTQWAYDDAGRITTITDPN
ncbi:MAG: RHS repeat protein, partial [Chloroflexi bacterium]|nr:RHS repeat protein [Chloroflexota bacterium]